MSLRSLVDVRFGGRAALVARMDDATGVGVRVEMFRVGGLTRARILAGGSDGWQLLAARWLPAGRGGLRLDVVGDRVQVFFNGRAALVARVAGIPASGSMGIELAGTRSRAENFAAFPAA